MSARPISSFWIWLVPSYSVVTAVSGGLERIVLPRWEPAKTAFEQPVPLAKRNAPGRNRTSAHGLGNRCYPNSSGPPTPPATQDLPLATAPRARVALGENQFAIFNFRSGSLTKQILEPRSLTR